MTWFAKPSGGFDIESAEAKSNMFEIYNQLSGTWSVEAICGLLGNMKVESGFNPWRWQSDKVDLEGDKKGYGLVQFTPAYGYINNYGKGVQGYAPNLSVNGVTEGADPSDGHAQIIVVRDDLAHKYIDRTSKCSYLDLSSIRTLADYRIQSDLWLTTVGWLFNYEYPDIASRTESQARVRYGYAQRCYEILTGEEPPSPPTPPPYPPVPPDPPVHHKHKMPLYMYLRRV